jgi:hypothetical protein
MGEEIKDDKDADYNTNIPVPKTLLVSNIVYKDAE